MKIRNLIAVWLLMAATGFCAEDYQARVDKLKAENGDLKQVVALLAEWREKQPDDPQAWITSTNYYINLAAAVNITTKPAEKGDMVVADPKTGKEVGSIAFDTDKKLMEQATGFLVTAKEKFPDRLDIWCGLAYIHHKNGDFEALQKILKEMAVYAKAHGKDLKWLKGEPLPKSADEFVPQQIHNHAVQYFEEESAEGLERCRKIAEIAVEYYPKHAYAFNDIAACYSAANDPVKEREWLEKAVAIDPTDVLILLNLGDTCVKLKDKDAARKYYQQVIDLKADAEYLEMARKGLAELKGK